MPLCFIVFTNRALPQRRRGIEVAERSDIGRNRTHDNPGWTGNILYFSDQISRRAGSVETWIWEFLPNGTIRNYPQGKPFAESNDEEDYIHWQIRGGELVLSWDHHFRRGASGKQRLRQAARLALGLLTDRRVPLAYTDRCAIHDEGGDSISFTLDPDEAEEASFVRRQFTLTRAEDSQPANDPRTE